MASPQQVPGPSRPTRRDESRRPAEIREIRAREVRSRGPGAGWLAWWWVWLAVILCAVWFAGWGWGGYGGWWWGNRGAVSTSGYPETAMPNGAASGSAAATGMTPGFGATANMNMVTGPGAAILTSADKRMYIGRPFQVNGAVVTKKVNNYVLWIGQGGNGASVLVVLEGSGKNAAHANVSVGDVVNVTGTMEKAPAQAQQNWKLSAEGQRRLEQQGAYVAASQVQRLSNGNND